MCLKAELLRNGRMGSNGDSPRALVAWSHFAGEWAGEACCVFRGPGGVYSGWAGLAEFLVRSIYLWGRVVLVNVRKKQAGEG